MILNFALLKDVPGERLAPEFAKLKDGRRYGHNLNNVWSLYKSTFGHSDLDRFDAVVSDLDRWEKLRYGGFPIGIATAMIFMPRREPWAVESSEPEDRYVLVLEDVDDLFSTILTASNINPRFVGVRFHSRSSVLDWYSKENQYSTISDPTPPGAHSPAIPSPTQDPRQRPVGVKGGRRPSRSDATRP